MATTSRVTVPFIGRLIEGLNLRYPTLFTLLALLTVVDLAVPDVVPLADELGLLLLTMLVGRWKARRPGTLESSAPSRGE